jgi:hypothetical protein
MNFSAYIKPVLEDTDKLKIQKHRALKKKCPSATYLLKIPHELAWYRNYYSDPLCRPSNSFLRKTGVFSTA